MYSGNVHSLSRYLFDIDVNNSSTDIETYYNFIDSNNLSNDAKLFLTLKTHRMQENGGNNQHTLESASFPRNWSTFTVVNLGKDPNYFSKKPDIYGNYTQLDSQSLVDLYNTDLKENTQPVIALKTVHNTFLSVTPGRNSGVLTQFKSNTNNLPYHRRNERFIVETIRPESSDYLVDEEDNDVLYRYKIKSLSLDKYLKVNFNTDEIMLSDANEATAFVIEADSGMQKCLAIDPEQNDHLEFNINRRAQYVKITPLSYVNNQLDSSKPSMKLKLLEKGTNIDILKQISNNIVEPRPNNEEIIEKDLKYEQFIRGGLFTSKVNSDGSGLPTRCKIMIANNDKIYKLLSHNTTIRYQLDLNTKKMVGRINISTKARFVRIKILYPSRNLEYESFKLY